MRSQLKLFIMQLFFHYYGNPIGQIFLSSSVDVFPSQRHTELPFRRNVEDNYSVGFEVLTGSVTIAIRQSGNSGSIPDRGKRFFCAPQRPDRLWGPTQPAIKWVPGALSPGVKRPGREAHHSPPSEVKNGGAASSLPHISSWSDP
jgi:hypothetical protein